ncbi:MAG: 16S rRNA (cytosine(1402)-N(4))-methyltransferase RsmH [Anaerovoracaceae bacterium]|jgi:16S rRNA (cytosine1402-N4)-methyltransferase
MEFKHTSVLRRECVEYLRIRTDGIYADGTLGGGGHAAAVCEKLGPQGLLLGIDRDSDALRAASARLAEVSCQTRLVQDNYANIKAILAAEGIAALDGALLDLGVSSFQLDNSERGFSYMQDAPLDMRMDRRASLTAADVVNGYSEKELAALIKKYGEERWAARIAKFIAAARKDAPITRTGRLVEIIKAAIPASARRDGPHPAKRTFQAIRIEVNDELGGLTRALEEFLDVLAPGGRLCVITFHSLEDRIVKNCFRDRADPCTCPPDFPVCVCGRKADVRRVTKKPVYPDDREVAANPRARSAKLRVAEKLDEKGKER